MTALIENYQLTADGPGKLGQAGPQITDAGTLLTPNDVTAPGGVLVGRNLVPTGYYHELKCISLSAWNQSGVASQVNTVGLNFGVVEILINGVVVWEFRSQDGLAQTTAGGDEMVSEYQNQSQQFNFGDGFVVPSGQVVLVRVTPGLKIPIRWCCEFFGSENQVQFGVTYTTTANQTVFTYTPSSDWTIKGFAFSSDSPGQVLGQMRLALNGLGFFNTGDLGMDDTVPTPVTNGWSNVAGYGNGGLFLPLWGIQIQQEDRITCYAHPWSSTNGVFQMTVFADEVAYGGGGGGIYPLEAEVITGIDYGPDGDNFTGNVELPLEADVRSGVGYGSNGSEFTGELAGGGAILLRRR